MEAIVAILVYLLGIVLSWSRLTDLTEVEEINNRKLKELIKLWIDICSLGSWITLLIIIVKYKDLDD